MTGRLLNETIGKIHFWLLFIGFNITFFPMHFLGMDGMPRRVVTYESGMQWDLWNGVATVGAFILAFSILIFLHNVFHSMRKGERASNDPWDGRTLEWSIPSPPPHYNFEEIPTVYSRDHHWETKYGNGGHGSPAPVAGASEDNNGQHGQHGTATGQHVSHEEGGHHGIHMPGMSYYPFVMAMGLTLAAYGVIYHDTLTWAASAVGAGVAIVAAYAWSFEPASEESGTEDE
jgi:cytochrome c oxidase subunit 1